MADAATLSIASTIRSIAFDDAYATRHISHGPMAPRYSLKRVIAARAMKTTQTTANTIQ
jgi:hypothetical protein